MLYLAWSPHQPPLHYLTIIHIKSTTHSITIFEYNNNVKFLKISNSSSNGIQSIPMVLICYDVNIQHIRINQYFGLNCSSEAILKYNTDQSCRYLLWLSWLVNIFYFSSSILFDIFCNRWVRRSWLSFVSFRECLHKKKTNNGQRNEHRVTNEHTIPKLYSVFSIHSIFDYIMIFLIRLYFIRT